MVDITSGLGTIKQTSPNAGFVRIIVPTAATANSGDTFTVTLSQHGISPTGLIGVLGWVHTTANSVVVQEQPTTSVAAGVLTVTVGGSSVTNKGRYYEIIGTSQ